MLRPICWNEQSPLTLGFSYSQAAGRLSHLTSAASVDVSSPSDCYFCPKAKTHPNSALSFLSIATLNRCPCTTALFISHCLSANSRTDVFLIQSIIMVPSINIHEGAF